MLAYMRIICIQYLEWFIFEESSSSQLYGLPGARLFFDKSRIFLQRKIFCDPAEPLLLYDSNRGKSEYAAYMRYDDQYPL